MGHKRNQYAKTLRRRNPVAHNAHKANKSTVYADKYQKAKRGYIKHKTGLAGSNEHG